MSHCFSKYTVIYNCKVGENLVDGNRDITHETHTTIFTNSRKHTSGLPPDVFQDVSFELFISYVHYLASL